MPKKVSDYSLSKLRKIIKKEVEKEISKVRLKDTNKKFEKDLETFIKEMLQGYHDALYRKDHVIKNYVRRRKS